MRMEWHCVQYARWHLAGHAKIWTHVETRILFHEEDFVYKLPCHAHRGPRAPAARWATRQHILAEAPSGLVRHEALLHALTALRQDIEQGVFASTCAEGRTRRGARLRAAVHRH